MLHKLLPTALLALSVTSGVVAAAFPANEADRRTVVTINEAISVQGTVLNPGEYVLKLADGRSVADVVQVYDRNEQHLITSALALPAYRRAATDDTEFTFYENSTDEPVALRTWFYPGDTYGFKFRNVVNRH